MINYEKLEIVHRRPNDILSMLISIVVFLVFAVFVAIKGVIQMEIDFFNLINGVSLNLGLPLKIIMLSGTIYGVGAAVLIAFLLRKKKIAIDLLFGGGLIFVLTQSLKILIGRVRPVGLIEPVLREVNTLGLGFPSGHTAILTTMALIVTPYMKKKYRKYVWIFVALIAIGRIYVGAHFPFDVVGGFFIGAFVGYAIRLIRGTKGYKPKKQTIIDTLKTIGIQTKNLELVEINSKGSLPFIVTTESGKKYFIKVIGPEQYAQDFIEKFYRSIVYRAPHRAYPYFTTKQKIEHEAYFNILARKSGARAPKFIKTVDIDDKSSIYVEERIEGKSLDKLHKKELTDDILKQVFEQIKKLQSSNIVHRDLRLDNFFVDKNKKVWITDFALAQSTKSKYLKGVDLAETLVGVSILAGIDRTIKAASSVFSKEELSDTLPVMQYFAFKSTTRRAIKKNLGILEDLKEKLSDFLGIKHIPKRHILRFRWIHLFVVAILALAIYYLVPKIGGLAKALDVISGASITLLLIALGIQAATYFVDGIAFRGSSRSKFNLFEAYMVQIAGTFLNVFTIKSIGLIAMDEQFLEKKGESFESASSSVAIFFIAKFALKIVVLVFLLLAIVSINTKISFNVLPELHILLIVFIALVGLGILLFIFVPKYFRNKLFRSTKKLFKAFLINTKNLLRTNPKNLFILSAGLILSFAGDALTLYVILQAFGTTANFFAIFAVLLGGNIISSAAPTPGNIGAIEASLIIGLTTIGIGTSVAIVAVLTYRLLNFWLPILPGIVAYQYLKRRSLI